MQVIVGALLLVIMQVYMSCVLPQLVYRSTQTD
jgi:hypothetical protein